MNDIKRQVERIIETDPVIKKGLQRGIINTRALTRWILETEGIDSTPDAVLGIIRRYPLSDHEAPGVSHVLGECELSLRNRVADFELEYHQNGTDPILRLAKYNGNTRSENIKLLVGSGLVRVISGQKALDNLISELLPGEVVRYSTDLAEISLRIPPRSGTRGLTAKITMELLLNDIDLWGIASFYWHHVKGDASPHAHPVTGEGLRELVLLVAEADGPRAIEALQRMLKENGGNSRQSGPWFSGPVRQGLIVGLGERLYKTGVPPTN
jgi:hypothetical protein